MIYIGQVQFALYSQSNICADPRHYFCGIYTHFMRTCYEIVRSACLKYRPLSFAYKAQARSGR